MDRVVPRPARRLAGGRGELRAHVLEKRVPSLDEIFVARVGTRIPANVED